MRGVRRRERLALGARLRQLPLGGVRDTAAVVDGRRGAAVQLAVVRQRFGDQLVPAAEPDQHVHPQRHERLQPVGHRRRLDGQQLRRELAGEFVGGLQARSATDPRTSPSRRRSADRARGRASRSSAALRARRTADRPAPQPDSPRPNCGSHRTARRCGWACAADDPRRAPGRAAGRRRAARPRGAPTSPSCAGRGAAPRDAPDRRRWPAPASRIRLASTTREPGAGSPVRGVPQRPCGHVDQRVGGQRLHVDVVGVGLRPASAIASA